MAACVLLDFQKDRRILLGRGFAGELEPIAKDSLLFLAIICAAYVAILYFGSRDISSAGNGTRWKAQSMAMTAFFFPFIGSLVYCLYVRKTRLEYGNKGIDIRH